MREQKNDISRSTQERGGFVGGFNEKGELVLTPLTDQQKLDYLADIRESIGKHIYTDTPYDLILEADGTVKMITHDADETKGGWYIIDEDSNND
jgi:hypothetical protein